MGVEEDKFDTTVVDSAGRWLDRNVRWIRYTSYVVGGIGLVVIARKILLFKKFMRPCDIPDHFVTSGVKLHGHVRRVTLTSDLEVDHVPVMTLPGSRKSHQSGELSVRLAGVEAGPEAQAWLQERMTGNHVWFQLLSRPHDDSCLYCSVSARKPFNSFFWRNVNEHLVREGIASVDPSTSLSPSPAVSRLLYSLSAAQRKAERKGRGMWARPPLWERVKETLSFRRLWERLRG